MDNVLVTVGIPTYNSGRFIGRCIESIINQTYKNIEILIVDNGSTDDTERIVRSFNDPRILFHRNPENIYCYGSTNVIIKRAKGEFVAIYHSDDIYTPAIVEKELNFLLKHNDVMAVFTEAHKINSKGQIIGEIKTPEILSDTEILDFKTVFNLFLKYGDFLICPSAMFVKRFFSKTGLFKEDRFFSSASEPLWLELMKIYGLTGDMIFTACDLEMWLRILQSFKIGILHEKLMYYRIHSSQGSKIYDTSYENFFIVMDYYERYAREKNLISPYYLKHYIAWKTRWIFSTGQKALLQSNYNQARKKFIYFLKKFHKVMPVIKFRDFERLTWAVFVIIFSLVAKRILDIYVDFKAKKEKINENSD